MGLGIILATFRISACLFLILKWWAIWLPQTELLLSLHALQIQDSSWYKNIWYSVSKFHCYLLRGISSHENKALSTFNTPPMGVVHSFPIKNIFYNKTDLRLFLFLCDDMIVRRTLQHYHRWHVFTGFFFFV